MNAVPITGIGVVAPGAIGVEQFAQLLRRGEPAFGPIDRFDTEGLRAHQAGLVQDFSPRDYIPPMKLRRMSRLSRYALVAAKLALQDAGTSQLDPATGVAIGTCFGPVQTSVDYMQEYVEKGASLAPPQLFAESVANAPGSHIAIELALRGLNITITQRESSAMAAAMFAASQIVKGTIPSALIGGVEEVNEMIFSVLDRLGALARSNGSEIEAARPLDRRRNGLVMGEGSAVMLAGGEGAPYGYLGGFGMARDPRAPISDWGDDPEPLVAAMRAAVEDAGLSLENIDAIYASANGSKRGDALEAAAINSLFPDSIPIVATKGYFGEYAGAGAMQLAAALLALREQSLHRSPGFEEAEEGWRLDVTRQDRPADLRNLLVNSLSAGGGIVCAVLSRGPL